ncbi:PAS domain-containing protein [Allokutzneria albata]|uniref:PAS fold-containing protein n=1 Tax=Allokutzneria albata TaxID=211114 RepID=A0A1G9TNT7_ALLAB|nr:PAS domain-containing protein [Allokutzneria albata]SDM49360.1 PAS fold-containing protein [Allokutzneria albata]
MPSDRSAVDGLLELLVATEVIAAFRDRDGRYVWASPAYQRMVGGEVTGTRVADWADAATAERVRTEDERVWAGHVVRWSPENPGHFTAAGGDRVWLAGRKSLVSGPLLGMIAVDTSAWLADRRELTAAQTRLSRFLAHAPAISAITDAEHRYVWVGGLGPVDALGRSVAEVLQPEVAAQVVEQNAAVLASGQSRQVRLSTPTEEWSGHRFPLPQPDGSTHVGALLLDVTEQERARRSAATWRNRFLALLDRSPVPTCVAAMNGRITVANPAMAAALGRRPRELVDADLEVLFTTTDTATRQRLLHELLTRRLARRSLHVTWAEHSGTLTVQGVPDEEGSVLLVTLTVDPVAAPEPPQLSLREKEVLTRIAAGESTAMIARALGLTVEGVTYHVTRMVKRFGVPNRTALVARAFTLGVLPG